MFGVKLKVWLYKIIKVLIDQSNLLLHPDFMLRGSFGFSSHLNIFFPSESHFRFIELFAWVLKDVRRQGAILIII